MAYLQPTPQVIRQIPQSSPVSTSPVSPPPLFETIKPAEKATEVRHGRRRGRRGGVSSRGGEEEAPPPCLLFIAPTVPLPLFIVSDDSWRKSSYFSSILV